MRCASTRPLCSRLCAGCPRVVFCLAYIALAKEREGQIILQNRASMHNYIYSWKIGINCSLYECARAMLIKAFFSK